MKKTFWLLIFSNGLAFALGAQESINNSATTSKPSNTPIFLSRTHDSHGGNGSQDQNSHGGNEDDHDGHAGEDHGQGNHHQGNTIAYEYLEQA